MTVLVVHGHRDASPEISSECILRVRRAEHYVRHHPVKLIVLSGAGRPGWMSEAEQMSRVAMSGPIGTGSVPVLLEQCSNSTVENACWTLSLLRRWGLDLSDVVVVTSWWHAPRVWAIWRLTGHHFECRRVRLVLSRGSWRYLPRELAPAFWAILSAIVPRPRWRP